MSDVAGKGFEQKQNHRHHHHHHDHHHHLEHRHRHHHHVIESSSSNASFLARCLSGRAPVISSSPTSALASSRRRTSSVRLLPAASRGACPRLWLRRSFVGPLRARSRREVVSIFNYAASTPLLVFVLLPRPPRLLLARFASSSIAASSARARPATGALSETQGQQLRQSVSARCRSPSSRSRSIGPKRSGPPCRPITRGS